MAEIVQQRIEERIPELEQLERVGLFTKKEVKSIIKRATALEYKLHRVIINKEDFIAYIQYEINVLELHIHYQFKREEIEFPIIHRINSIFRRATYKWKDDVQLWLSHVAFCRKWATKTQLSKVFSTMLAIHSDKPALWIMAAKSELEDRDSSESARHLFLRALRFHPNNQKVYQEYFRMELLHCEKLRKQKEELEKAEVDLGEYEFSPEILSGKLAEVVYKNATENIKEAAFVISLLTIAAIFDFTKDLQSSILQEYVSPLHTFFALRELEAPSAGEELQTAKGRASDMIRTEERCSQVYEEGIKSLNSGTTLYVHTLRTHYFKKPTPILSVINHPCLLLLSNMYHNIIGLQILLSSGDAEGAERVAMAAMQRFSQSVSVWNLSLQTLMELGSDNVGSLLQEALKHINPKESLTLWKLQIQWSTANQSPAQTEAVFKAALRCGVPAVSMEIKDCYLSWSYTTGGYKKARKIFTSLQEIRPLSKAFFIKMIQIEKDQETPRMNYLRDYYERALQEFGTTDENLWLQYIQEELGPGGQPENSGKIHWRAMKFLEGESVERFTSKYTLLQTGHL
uniref:UTP6 small subunit processome component n=1 Tax=Cynoglossus semilaevis TaxID=244447 RepID=A0A3P8W9H0_CYNSE